MPVKKNGKEKEIKNKIRTILFIPLVKLSEVGKKRKEKQKEEEERRKTSVQEKLTCFHIHIQCVLENAI